MLLLQIIFLGSASILYKLLYRPWFFSNILDSILFGTNKGYSSCSPCYHFHNARCSQFFWLLFLWQNVHMYIVIVIRNRLGYLLCDFFRHLHIWGWFYDHNFLQFLPIFCKKLAFFPKINVMIKFLQKLAVVRAKNAKIFANFFGENILKIIS
jgi:hypothetical protein